MSTAIVIDGQEIWSGADEEFLQDRMERRDREEAEAAIMRHFRKQLKERCGEEVTLLVDHPFNGLPWQISCELPDARGFFRCVCDNGFECVFHESELTTNRNI